jgi:hypothetical protein
VRHRWHGTGRGPDLDVEFTVIYAIRRGTILFMEYFWDHTEALETLGLPKQDAHADF